MKTCYLFLRFVCLGLVLAGANCWADIYQIDVLIPYECGGATICTAVALNNNGAVLWQMAGGGGDNGILVWGTVRGGGEFAVPIPISTDSGIITTVTRFDAPWAENTTFGDGLDDAGDVFFHASGHPSEELAWGTTNGYGILTHDGILVTDLSNWEAPPSGPHPTNPLSNNRGQFVALVPDARFPQENDWALFTPIPEPSSLLLLGTLAVPALIRLRKRRWYS